MRNKLQGKKPEAPIECDPRKEAEKKLNRRQFIKIGAAGVTASAIGMSILAENKGNLLADVAKENIPEKTSEFPVVITNKCERMNQKYTVFCRRLWDRAWSEKLKAIEEKRADEYLNRVQGWTPLDRALERAGWALESKLSPGSASGSPLTEAYQWEGRVGPQKFKFQDPDEASTKVKRAARFLGASLVGIAEYNPLWTYSHLVKARFDRQNTDRDSPRYDLIPPQFPFEPKSVVVIAIEMDYKGIALSPSAIESAATGLGYSQMSAIGYSVATFIRGLGYKSFACGNDVSLSVPYAVAAGLGELGRNGLLITWDFGPRVRLVKVFTELAMKPDQPKTYGIWDFCKSCKRCAESCPSDAISFDKPTFEGPTISNNPGVLKWYVDPEKCYQFWRENGSDCANCITACPFNKLKMWHHRLSAAFTILPVAPLHSLMVKMDKAFGFGDTHNSKDIAEFWDES